MFVVGRPRKSGSSRNPFLCQCSLCAQPECQANLYGIDPVRFGVSLECLEAQCPESLGRPANVLPRPHAASRLGSSETRITDRHVDHHQAYIHRLVGIRGPQAPAIFRRSESGMRKPQFSFRHMRKVLKARPAYRKVCRGVDFCLPNRECVALRIRLCTSQPRRSLVIVW